MAGTMLDIIVQAQQNPNLLLTSVLLPFLLIFVVMWGMLNMIKIFGDGPVSRKVNIILALCVALLAGITPAWSIITGMAAFLGEFTWVAFFIVFIIGTILWMAGRTRGVYHDQWSSTYRPGNYDNLKNLDKEIARLRKEIQKHAYSDPHKAEVLVETLKHREKEKENILAVGSMAGRH
ncbi:MAG: hypothetical protein HY833_01105 [Candidatus Aenigmarchaeota archaeon]|nr:hypothetical protein [Candidatus Aenigmarchaeota archaeon]